jgi:hypothetical protein
MPKVDPNRVYLESLKKAEPFTGFRESDGERDYKVQFVGRGEMAFFQEDDRAMLINVLAGRGTIFESSIKRWDDGKKVTPEEKQRVIEKVGNALKKLGADEIRVVE